MQFSRIEGVDTITLSVFGIWVNFVQKFAPIRERNVRAGALKAEQYSFDSSKPEFRGEFLNEIRPCERPSR